MRIYVYWFMYTLIGLIISAPFWAKLLNSLSDIEIKILFLFTLIIEFVSTYILSNIFNISFGINNWILTVNCMYFLMGYLVDSLIKTKQQICSIILIGFIGVILAYWSENFLGYYNHSQFPLCFYSLGLYLILERILVIKNNYIKVIISFLAKYSFGIYLIHPAVLDFLAGGNRIIQYFPYMNEKLLFICNVLLTLSFSLMAAIAIDTFVIYPTRKILRKMLKL